MSELKSRGHSEELAQITVDISRGEGGGRNVESAEVFVGVHESTAAVFVVR